MEARKLFTFVFFFLAFAFAAQESMGKTCDLTLKTSCVNDASCKVQCPPDYPVGLCLLGRPTRVCVCRTVNC
ncbi:hypothetical protein ABFS83_08G192500 [Erythranthe nasuta]